MGTQRGIATFRGINTVWDTEGAYLVCGATKEGTIIVRHKGGFFLCRDNYYFKGVTKELLLLWGTKKKI